MFERNKIIYMKDDFYEQALKMDGSKRYLKFCGREEREVAFDNDTAYQIRLGGDIISKEEYENY